MIQEPRAGWVVAGFDGPCEWGDWISPGDRVTLVFDPLGDHDELPIGWEHKDCRETEGPVRPVVKTSRGFTRWNIEVDD